MADDDIKAEDLTDKIPKPKKMQEEVAEPHGPKVKKESVDNKQVEQVIKNDIDREEIKKKAQRLIEKQKRKEVIKRFTASIILFGLLFTTAFAIAFYASRDERQVIYVPSENTEAEQQSQSPTPTTIREIDTSNWETYEGEDVGVSFKHPTNFHVRTVTETVSTAPVVEQIEAKSKIQISNSENFEEDEFAMLMTIEKNEDTNFSPADDPETLMALENIGFSNLNSQFSNFLSGNFFDDPPHNYYQIVIPYQGLEGSSLLFTTRVHNRIDELSSDEGGTEGKMVRHANAILSTVRLINNNVQGTTDISCLESQTEMLSEVEKCETITEQRCEELKVEYDECINACADNLNEEQCTNVCRPVCDYEGASL